MDRKQTHKESFGLVNKPPIKQLTLQETQDAVACMINIVQKLQIDPKNVSAANLSSDAEKDLLKEGEVAVPLTPEEQTRNQENEKWNEDCIDCLSILRGIEACKTEAVFN